MRVTALVCLAFIATASAVPARWFEDTFQSSSYCALECSASSSSKFNYQPDTTYLYDYKVTTPFPLDNRNTLTISALAEIQVIDQCEYALRLKETRMMQLDASFARERYPERLSEFQRDLEQNTLTFAFQDGVVSSLCPDERESNRALNFKRGLLTAFQNSMDQLDQNQRVQEIDVTGNCEAEYNVTKSWGWQQDITVIKRKDLNACSQRDGHRSAIQSVQYKVPSEIQSNPILESSQSCQYVIDSSSKILKSAKCEETHQMSPIATQQAGKAVIVQELTFKGSKRGVDSGKVHVTDRRSLAFEHDVEPKDIANSREAAEQKVKEICQQTREDIRPETPRLFSELVSIVRVLDFNDLERVHRLLKDKVICPNNEKAIKFFRDALPMAMSSGAVRMMSSLIRNKEVNGPLAEAWLGILALIKEPTREMISEANLLAQQSIKEKTLLPVTALAHAYIKNNPDAVNEEEVQRLANTITYNIPRYCAVDENSVGDVLLVLKAIGNMGGLKSLADTLNTCISSSYAPLQVKVAAIQAYRRLPCQDSNGQRDEKLWSLLSNVDADSELRIASYVSIMRCPDDETLDRVANLLRSEEDEHVGAYIYSHLKNLGETSDPLKQNLAKAVNKLTLKEFEINPLKHSRNHEASFLLNKINVGFTADNDVIVSPKSPLPRSLRANLTVDLFGHSVHLLEIGGRSEGLEYLIEELLSPYGYFPKSSENKKYSRLSEVKASAYARIFGNDIAFSHIEGFDNAFKPIKVPKLKDIFVDNQAISSTFSYQLMDVSLVVPTIAGLPLELTVNGTADFNIEAKGTVDFRKAFSSPRSLQIDGFFKPSSALEITGSFVIDAGIAKTGLRMRNTIHSSTGINGRIELSRGSSLNIEIDPPKDKMEIFNANSEIFALIDGTEEKIPAFSGRTEQKDYTYCTGETASYVFGVKFCGQVVFPVSSRDSTYSPLAGPTKFSVVSYRTDSHSTYKLMAKVHQNKERSIAQFLVGTPGSRINRMISTDLTITHSDDKQLELTIVAPWQKISANSVLIANREIISASSSIVINDQDKYGLTSEVKINKNKGHKTYVPFVEVTIEGRRTPILSGQIEISLPQTSEATLQIQAPGYEPYDLKAVYQNKKHHNEMTLSVDQQGKNKYIFSYESSISRHGKNVHFKPKLTIASPKKTLIDIEGSADIKPERSLSGDVQIDVYKMKRTTARFAAKKHGKGKNQKYEVDASLKSSLINTDFEFSHTIRHKNLATSWKLHYTVPKVGKDTISWNGKVMDKSSKSLTKYIISSNLESTKYSQYNTRTKINFDHKKKLSSADLEVKYGNDAKNKDKVVKVSMSTTRNHWDIDDLSKVDVKSDFKMSNPEKDIDVEVLTDHTHSPKKLVSSVSIEIHPLLKNKIFTKFNLADKSGKTAKWIGHVDMGAFGKTFSVNSDLTQKSTKQYTHSMDIICSETGKHSFNTVYKKRGKDKHEVTSSINLQDAEPIRFQAESTLDPFNLGLSGKITHGDDIYSASALSKIAKDNAGKWRVELVHPDRKIEASLEGKKMNSKYDASMFLDWDADRKNVRSQIAADASWRHVNEKGSMLVKGDLNLKTPHDKLRHFSADIGMSKTPSEYAGTSRVSLGRQKFSSTFSAKRPLSFKNAQMSYSAKTPFENWKEVEFELDHKLNPTFFTHVKSKLENKRAEVLLTGENKGNAYQTDLSGSLSVKLPYKVLRNLNMSVEHRSDGRNLQSSGSVDHNGRKYEADLIMSRKHRQDHISNNGELKLKWPEDSSETTWEHSIQGTRQLKSTVNTVIGNNKRYEIKIIGTNQGEWGSKRVKGNMEITIPKSGNILVTLDHSHQPEKLNHEFLVVRNGVQTSLVKLILEKGYKSANGEFQLKGPNGEHIFGETEVSYAKYPKTASAFIQWAPRTRIAYDGAWNVISDDNMDFNLKVTTPFEDRENIIIKASHRREGPEYVSHANVDYGVRKSIDFENRIRYDRDTQMIRTTFSTPFRTLRSMKSGIRAESSRNKFEGDFDFELLPLVKKHDGFVVFKLSNGDYNGEMRLNTPHEDLESVQLTSRWANKGKSGKDGFVEVKVKPQGIFYRVDSSYNADLPFHYNIDIDSSQPELKDLGLTLVFNPQPKNTHSQLLLKYQPGKAIDAVFKLSLEGNIDGSLRVTTPFAGYKKNQIVVLHDVSKRGFSSHGEARLGKNFAEADLSFSSGRTTSGAFSIKSSAEALVDVKGDMKVRGNFKNMKGQASLDIGEKSVKAGFTNHLESDSWKSSLQLHTPYTEDLKAVISVDDLSKGNVISLKSDVDADYGDKSFEGKLRASVDGIVDDSFQLSLKLPVRDLKFIKIHLDHQINEEEISGQGSIKFHSKSMDDISLTYRKSGPITDMDAKVSMKTDSESLIDLTIQTQKPSDEIHGKIISKGKLLPSLVAQMDHAGGLMNFNTKTQLAGRKGVLFYNDFTFVVDDQNVNIDGQVSYDLMDEKHIHSVKIIKKGSPDNFKIELSTRSDGDEIKGKIEFESQDKIRLLAEIENLFKRHKFLAAEFEHSGDLNKFLTTASVFLDRNEAITGRVNYYAYDLKVIEASAELSTPFDDYRYSKLEYRFENSNDKITSFIEGKLGQNDPLVADVTLQMKPNDYYLNYILKTPFEHAKRTTVSSTFNGKMSENVLEFGEGKVFKVNFNSDVSEYSEAPQIEILTPFEMLKKMVVNLRKDYYGKINGNVEIASLGKVVSGNNLIHIENPLKMTLSGELNSDIEGMEHSKFVFQLDAERDSEQSGLVEILYVQGQGAEVIFNGRMSSKTLSWNNQKDVTVEVDGKLEPAGINSFSGVLEHSEEPSKRNSKTWLSVNNEQILNADVSYEGGQSKQLTINVRQPRPMELHARSVLDKYSREDELFLNWNRDDPSSNVRVETSIKNKPGYHSLDHASSILITRPYRTMGAEFNANRVSNNIAVSGKMMWDKLRNGQVSYNFDLNDNSRRRDKSYDSTLKVVFPSRTIGATGSLSSNAAKAHADALFSWDMDRDETKQIGVQATMTGRRYQYAKGDFSVTLPADVQVATEIILNQDNAIYDGKTEITYSKDTRKTLTVYSKLLNNAQYYNRGFNYSVEVGVSHPDTRLDIQLDSYVAKTQESLSSKFGVRYLTDRRAVKNMALFAEIDSLKRQINLVADSPTKSHALTSTLQQDKPFVATMSYRENRDEQLTSYVKLDCENKKLNFEIGQPDNLITLEATSPNKTAILIDLSVPGRYREQPPASIHTELVTPSLLTSRISWNPRHLTNIKNAIIDQAELARVNSRQLIQDLNRDIQAEVVAKYQTITRTLLEDSEPFVEFFKNEFETVSSAIDEYMEFVEDQINNNEFFLKDLMEISEQYSPEVYTISNLRKLRNIIQKTSKQILQEITERLRQLRDYPIDDAYTQIVTQRVNQLLQDLDEVIASSIQAVRDFRLEKTIRMRIQRLRESLDIPRFEEIKAELRKFRDMDVDEILERADQAYYSGLEQGQELYQQHVHPIVDSIQQSRIVEVIPDYVKQRTAEAVAKVYETAKWTADKWELEQRLREAVRSNLQLWKEIIEVEMREFEDGSLHRYNPVKVYEPRDGLILVEVPLPVEVAFY